MADSLVRILQTILNNTTLGRTSVARRINRFVSAHESVTITESTSSADVTNKNKWGSNANEGKWSEFTWG
jgi:hypothetical protein